MPAADVDQIARTLAAWGRYAKALPPSWCGAGIAHPVKGPEGQHIGRILPGRGLYLDCDVKRLGITRGKIPFVFERSPTRRLFDLLHDERGAVTSMATLRGGVIQTVSNTFVPPSGGDIQIAVDLWALSTNKNTGVAMTYTSYPGGKAYDSSDSSLLNYGLWDPVGSDTTYLVSFGINTQLAGQTNPNGFGWYIISDLLVAAGAIPTDGSVAFPITIDTTALPRYTTGAGVMACWIIANTFDTLQGVTVTGSYVNQAGATKSYTYFGWQDATSSVWSRDFGGAYPGAPATIPFMPLAANDYGVRQVNTISLGANDGAGSQVAVQLQYPLCFVPGTNAADDYFEYDSYMQNWGLVQLAGSGGHNAALTVTASPVGAFNQNQPFTVVFKFVQG